MVDTPPDAGSTRASRRLTPAVITDAKTGSSRELASREKRYAITMGIRMVCFLSMIFVSGPFRWVLLAGAVFLPYLAVIFANQANNQTTTTVVPQAEPSPALQLTVGEAPPEVITGDVLDDDDLEGDGWARHDRVA